VNHLNRIPGETDGWTDGLFLLFIRSTTAKKTDEKKKQEANCVERGAA